MKVTTFVSFALLIQCANTLNILGIFPYEGKSHFFVFKVLLKELAERGYNVTVVSHFPEANPIKNYHDIKLDSDLVVESKFPIFKSRWTATALGITYLLYTGAKNCKSVVSNPGVQKLIDEKWKFDVVLVEEFNNDCAYAIAHKLDTPVVGVTSHILMPWHYERLGIPYNGAYIPFHFLEGGKSPSLFQRVERFVIQNVCTSLYSIATRWSHQGIVHKYLGDDVPSLYELTTRKKLTLLYHHLSLSGSTHLPTNAIEVGGFHVAPSKPLTGELKKFMDEAKHGVIYISFGSVASVASFSQDMLDALVNVVKTLPQRFVIKFDNSTLGEGINNVYLAKWLPQSDILGHPNLVAFYTHGGMLSTTEATSHGVPLVVTPIFGDQPANAATIEEAGMGVSVSLWDMNKENLLAAFTKVLDPKFRARVKEISKLFKHRPNTAMDTAVFWIDYAAKLKDINYTPPGANTPCYQKMGLDVYAVLAAGVLVIVLIFRALFKICSGKKQTKPEKKSHKQKAKRS